MMAICSLCASILFSCGKMKETNPSEEMYDEITFYDTNGKEQKTKVYESQRTIMRAKIMGGKISEEPNPSGGTNTKCGTNFTICCVYCD